MHMKKYLVIKRYKTLSPDVETSFDVKDEYKTSALSLANFTFGKLCL